MQPLWTDVVVLPQELVDILEHTIQEADDVSDDEDEDEDEEGAFYSESDDDDSGSESDSKRVSGVVWVMVESSWLNVYEYEYEYGLNK